MRVINYLRVQGPPPRVAEILSAIAVKKVGVGSMDFNAITPMPAWVYTDALDSDTCRTQGHDNCWLDWCRANWRIEWNAMEGEENAAQYDGGDMIRFITKDSDVRYLMEQLSRIYQDVYIDYLWAAEDIDRGAGTLQFRAGRKMVSYLPAPGSKAAYELAFNILHTTPEDHGLLYDEKHGTYGLKGAGQLECCENR